MTNTPYHIQIRPLGDSALVVQLGDGIDVAIHEKVAALLAILEAKPFTGYIEATPSYTNLTIYYNPVDVHFANEKKTTLTSFEIVQTIVMKYVEQLTITKKVAPRQIDIPVVYGNEFGPDLEYVANYHNLTPEKVIAIHSQQEYLVYMLGFAPGFPFLGGMNDQIATPRKESPRRSIASGSVGIAGKQTGVYPLETPGGWQIIGQASLDLFLPKQNPPTLLQAGDIIRFIPSTSEVFKQ